MRLHGLTSSKLGLRTWDHVWTGHAQQLRHVVGQHLYAIIYNMHVIKQGPWGSTNTHWSWDGWAHCMLKTVEFSSICMGCSLAVRKPWEPSQTNLQTHLSFAFGFVPPLHLIANSKFVVYCEQTWNINTQAQMIVQTNATTNHLGCWGLSLGEIGAWWLVYARSRCLRFEGGDSLWRPSNSRDVCFGDFM